MSKPKKITQNINKDAGLMDLPSVRTPRSKWETKHSNYLTCNIGDIVPIYVDEVLPSEKRKVTMGMLSHMTTPIAPIFNAQYTEFRAFYVPYRMAADLLGGYSTRRSPWVKVFGEDNASTSSQIIVPLANQTLPSVNSNLQSDFTTHLEAFGGIADALGYENNYVRELNFLDMAAYELIYQYCYRNENREAATNSNLYKWLFNLYNRTSVGGINYDDKFHIANREKDYFTGAQPFAQKGDPVNAGLLGELPVIGVQDGSTGYTSGTVLNVAGDGNTTNEGDKTLGVFGQTSGGAQLSLMVDLKSATGVNIEQLRLMIKTQELLEKDMMYGSDYASSLNAHFGTCPISLIVEKPLELKKVTITSQMQPIFQTSTTASEPTILGTIGANATTQSGEFEIVPETEFKEYGLLIICAVHKAQNSYDASLYKPKRIHKKSRFDFFTPELNDIGYQPIKGIEYNPASNSSSANIAWNEGWAEYRFKFNSVHGMFEPSRTGAYSFWTLACSGYTDIQSLYKQSTTELDRAVSIAHTTMPQFFDAYGFIEINDKPMSLHSIPGMDGVI